MNFEDLIGLIISIVVFVFLMIRSASKKVVEQEEEALPPPVPTLKKKRLDLQKKPTPFISVKEAETYEVIGKRTPSRAHQLLSQLKSKKDMIILNEILKPPKGMQ